MWKKLKNLFNPRKWIQDVIFTKVAAKAGKYAAATVAALFAAPSIAKFLESAKPLLDQAGIDATQVATVFLTAAFGALLNWLKNGPLKD